MKITSRFISTLALTLSFLLTAHTAHADFRKALDAYIARDGETMLKEVKDSVDKKNDDGIILFLGILKQYSKTWRSMLNEAQQTELFNSLEAATSESSLQVQYKFAVIPRKENNPPPIPTGTDKDRESWFEARKKEKLKEYQDQITNLEPVANKGYAPAALQLYANYSHHLVSSKLNQETAMQWLKKAAELGDPVATYLLGMKYLHVVDEMYGCTSSGLTPPNCQLPKDEAKGWHWMQAAAQHANEPSMMVSALDDFALNMGDLYMQGVAGNKPDYEQAYLWYRRMPFGFTVDTSPVWPKLQELRKLGQLKYLNPALDKAWGNASTWQEAVKSDAVIKALQSSPFKLPILMQKGLNKNNQSSPMFSMSTVRWYQPNASYAGIVLDVYGDGRVNLLIGDSSLNESNDELWMRIQPHQVKAFVDEMQNLKLESMSWTVPCEAGCVETLGSIIYLNNYQKKIVTLNNTSFKASLKLNNHNLKQSLSVVEKYFPFLQLTCDADVQDGKNICYEIYQDILRANQKGEK